MTATLDGRMFGEENSCFGCAPDHKLGFHLEFTTTEEGVRTTFTPGSQYQGPPGVMHGGLVMTLADEIAAWSIIAKLGKFGFTISANCRFHRPVRIEIPVESFGRIKNPRRRTVDVDVEIFQENTLAFSAELRFAVLDVAGAERLLNRPLPEAWRKFGR